MIEYDICVVGAGMIGSACARHLLETHPKFNILLIGPSERKDRQSITIHGAHYDEARVTRVLDPDPTWALLGKRSIDRYRDLEKKSGVKFYNEVGFLTFGNRKGNHVSDVIRNSRDLNESIEVLSYDNLSRRYPYIEFDKEDEGVLTSRRSGWINPRKMVTAQKKVFMRLGGTYVDDVVCDLQHGEIVLANTDGGQSFRSKKILLATGAFTNCRSLLPAHMEPRLRLQPEMVLFFEVDEKEITRMLNFPPIIMRGYEGPGGPPNFEGYILPPIKYPDGHVYIKIGHGAYTDLHLDNPQVIHEWYCKGGNKFIRDELLGIARKYFPNLPLTNHWFDYCVTAHTPTDQPYVDMVTPTLGVALGGCGKSAKSSDEIGRMAACMISKGSWDHDLPGMQFALLINNDIKSNL